MAIRKKRWDKSHKVFSTSHKYFESGRDQLVLVHTAAGDYAKFISTILKELMKLTNLNHFVTSRVIRELLQIALDKRNYINSDDVINARVKAKLWIKQIKVNSSPSKLFIIMKIPLSALLEV